MYSEEFKIACETQAMIDRYYEEELKTKKKKTMHKVSRKIYTNYNYGGAK